MQQLCTFNGITVQPTLQDINRVRRAADLPEIQEWQAVMAYLAAKYTLDDTDLIPEGAAAEFFGGVEGFHRALDVGFAGYVEVISDPGFMRYYLLKMYEAIQNNNATIATLTSDGFAPGVFRYFSHITMGRI